MTQRFFLHRLTEIRRMDHRLTVDRQPHVVGLRRRTEKQQVPRLNRIQRHINQPGVVQLTRIGVRTG
ncbi:hypothetical protein QR98_0103640, partial [Sarcoptes scabiei]